MQQTTRAPAEVGHAVHCYLCQNERRGLVLHLLVNVLSVVLYVAHLARDRDSLAILRACVAIEVERVLQYMRRQDRQAQPRTLVSFHMPQCTK